MAKQTKLAEAKAYVAKERKKRVADEAIMRAMLDTGWKASDIAAALENPKLPEHIVERNRSGYHRSLAERFRELPRSSWITFLAATAWLLLFFWDSGPILLITLLPLVALLFAGLFLYEQYGKEWMLRLLFLANAGILALALFTLSAWLVSFLWQPMTEQLLFLTLLPGMLLTFLLQEYAYHAWLGEHDKHTLTARIRRGLSYSLLNFFLTFLILALVAAFLAQQVNLRGEQVVTAHTTIFDQVDIPGEIEGLQVVEEGLALQKTIEPRALYPERKQVIIDSLLFKDMSQPLEEFMTMTTNAVRNSIGLSLTLLPVLEAHREVEYQAGRGEFYDGTKSKEEHYEALQAGNLRLRAAINTLPGEEITYEPIAISPESALFSDCLEEERSSSGLFDATAQRFYCSSRITLVLAKGARRVGESATEEKERYSNPDYWMPKEGERFESALLRAEVERSLLQQELQRKLGRLNPDFKWTHIQERGPSGWSYQVGEPNSEQVAFAAAHLEDPYFGPALCAFLPESEDPAADRGSCASKWARPYHDKGICIMLYGKSEREACEDAILEEEALIYG